MTIPLKNVHQRAIIMPRSRLASEAICQKKMMMTSRSAQESDPD